MKRIKHSEAEIISILKKQEQGIKVAEICRSHGISEPTFYNWKSRYGGMEVNAEDLFWINKKSDFKSLSNNHIAIDTSLFTYQEILSIISENNSSLRSFYIRPKNKNYVIGDDKQIINL